MLLHRFEDWVLLYRRPPTGIWGGLWSLPEVEDVDDIGDWQDRVLSSRTVTKSIAENVLRHQFTHFSLDISIAEIALETLPEKIADNDDMVFVAFNDLAEFGLPTPVRKILSTAFGSYS